MLPTGGVQDVRRRDVEEKAPGDLAFREGAQDFLHAEEVQLRRYSLLRRRAEQLGRRLDERALRAAHQRLASKDAAFAKAEDRLENGGGRAPVEDLAKLPVHERSRLAPTLVSRRRACGIP